MKKILPSDIVSGAVFDHIHHASAKVQMQPHLGTCYLNVPLWSPRGNLTLHDASPEAVASFLNTHNFYPPPSRPSLLPSDIRPGARFRTEDDREVVVVADSPKSFLLVDTCKQCVIGNLNYGASAVAADMAAYLDRNGYTHV